MDDCSNHDDRTNKFDQIVGALEALVLTAEFEQLQDSFCRSHCHHFEATDENKLIYMEIFQNYTASVEEFLEKGLSQAVPGFDMGEFMSMLAERQDELAGEVFDMLLSLSDFSTFKDIMVSYKAETCSDVSSGGGFSLSLSVTPLSIVQRDEASCSAVQLLLFPAISCSVLDFSPSQMPYPRV